MSLLFSQGQANAEAEHAKHGVRMIAQFLLPLLWSALLEICA